MLGGRMLHVKCGVRAADFLCIWCRSICRASSNVTSIYYRNEDIKVADFIVTGCLLPAATKIKVSAYEAAFVALDIV